MMKKRLFSCEIRGYSGAFYPEIIKISKVNFQSDFIENKREEQAPPLPGITKFIEIDEADF